MYSAALGRFPQTDPVGYTADLNLYTYVGNDPVGRTDPTGEAAEQCATDQSGNTTCTGDIETVIVTGRRPQPPLSKPGLGLAALVMMGGMSAAGAESPSVVPAIATAAGTLVVAGIVCAATRCLSNESSEQENQESVDIDDPNSVRGADPDAVAEAAKEKGYTESEARNKEGTRYTSPNGSDQVRIMRGNPNRPDPVKRGPYAVIAKSGVKTIVPLKGNPSL